MGACCISMKGTELGERLEVFDLKHDWKVIYPPVK
jgi:hypothetical protein